MKTILFFILLFLYNPSNTRFTTLNAHSHNDYLQQEPFYQAYINHFGSIEADIWAVNGDLYVSHEKEKISQEKTLDNLYIKPIVNLYKQNAGKAWPDCSGSFQLMIELKTEAGPTLDLLIEKLKKYPEVFDRTVNKSGVLVVITGNQPPPDQFNHYPDFIRFDGSLKIRYSNEEIRRVALFSSDLEHFTSWKGIGQIPETDQKKLIHAIDSVHTLKCKIRFWNAPDTPDAWQALRNLGVDYINTDRIQQLSKYLNAKD